MHCHIADSLSIAFWNTDGLHFKVGNSRQSKLSESQVIDYFTKHDIICRAETLCKPSDSMSLAEYSVASTIRPKSKNANKYTGGIAVLINKNIGKGIKLIEATNFEHRWFTIHKSFLNRDGNIYVATVFASSSRTIFSARNEAVSDQIEADIIVFSSVGNCILFGTVSTIKLKTMLIF